MARKELEIEMKELGCPYPIEDVKASTWMKGYEKGFKDAMAEAMTTVSEVFG